MFLGGRRAPAGMQSCVVHLRPSVLAASPSLALRPLRAGALSMFLGVSRGSGGCLPGSLFAARAANCPQGGSLSVCRVAPGGGGGGVGVCGEEYIRPCYRQ